MCKDFVKKLFCLLAFSFCLGLSSFVFAENLGELIPPRIIEKASLLYYPDEAKAAGIEGEVVIRIFVQDDGSVVSVIVAKSSGNQLLDEAAVEHGRSFVFSPARGKDGVAVKSVVSTVISFQLDNEKGYERERSKFKSLPKIKREPKFILPRELAQTGTAFRVKLRYFINTDGKVTSVLLRQSSGFEAFDKAAIEYARKCIFYPAKDLDGKPARFTGTKTFIYQKKMFTRFGN